MPTIVTLFFLLLSIAVIVTITLAQYGIVLDADSSRTTVYVYEWPAEKENNTGVVSQTFKCNVKGPGISSYGSNPQEISIPINDCMNKVKEKIPFHLHKSIPVYLGATAGMRLLRYNRKTIALSDMALLNRIAACNSLFIVSVQTAAEQFTRTFSPYLIPLLYKINKYIS